MVEVDIESAKTVAERDGLIKRRVSLERQLHRVTETAKSWDLREKERQQKYNPTERS